LWKKYEVRHLTRAPRKSKERGTRGSREMAESLNLRKLDPELCKLVKVRAAEAGTTMQRWMEAVLWRAAQEESSNDSGDEHDPEYCQVPNCRQCRGMK
jgi:predicted HicB family RNase H-like nuclease